MTAEMTAVRLRATRRALTLGLALLLAALAPTWTPAWAQNRTPPTSREMIHLSFAPVVKKVSPAVVNVYSRRTVQTHVSHVLAKLGVGSRHEIEKCARQK